MTFPLALFIGLQHNKIDRQSRVVRESMIPFHEQRRRREKEGKKVLASADTGWLHRAVEDG